MDTEPACVAFTNEPEPRIRNVPFYLALLPVLLCLAVMVVLHLASPTHPITRVVFEPPFLLPILNTIFVFLVGCIVSYLAMRGYLSQGSPTILFLGCGLLSLGSGAFVAGWLIGPWGPNVNTTVFTLSALLSSIFHMAGMVVNVMERPPEADLAGRRRKLAIAYPGLLGLIALIALAAVTGIIPPFFVRGAGPTVLRQVFVAITLALFIVTASSMMVLFVQKGVRFLYWYSLGLALFAVNTFGALLQPALGSPMGWVARGSLYLAGIYFFVAVVSALRGARTEGVALSEKFARIFLQSERKISFIFDSMTDCYYELDREWRFTRINDRCLAYFGRNREAFIGQLFGDVFPEDKGSIFEEQYRKAFSEGIAVHFEVQSLVVPDRWADVHAYPTDEGLSVFVRDITERKQAEFALRESERRWATTLASIGDAVIATDVAGRITFMNAVAEELTGWRLTDAATKPVPEVFNIINEQTRREVENPVTKVLREGMIVGLANHTILVRKDGTEVPIDDSGAPIRDADGKTMGVVLVFRDITDRKATEEALRQSDERFRLALRNAPVSVAVQNSDLQYIWAYNQRTARPEEIIGKRDEDIFAPEEAARLKVIKRRVIEDNIEHREQMWFNRPSGPIFLDIYWEPIHDEAGRVTGVGSATVDLTPIKLAAEAVRDGEQRFSKTFYRSPTAMIITRPSDQRVIEANDSLLNLFELSREETIGRRVVDDLHMYVNPDEDRAEIVRLFNEHGNVPSHEVRMRTKTGKVLTVLFSSEMINFGGEGNVACTTIIDITERRRAEDALQENEAKYRNLFENMTEEVHFWKLVRDEEGHIKTWRLVDANPPTLKTWGKTLDEIKGKTTDEIFGPGATDHYMPVVQKIVTEGVPYYFEDYFPYLDKHFRFTSVPFGDYFITTGADITALKRTEEILRKSRDELELRVEERTAELRKASAYNRNLIEASIDPLVTIDQEGRISDANVATEQSTGYSRYELIGTDFSDYFTDPQKARDGYRTVFNEGFVCDYPLEIRHRDGHITPVLYNASVYRDDTGSVIGVFAAARDVSERQKLEAQLRQAQKMEAVGTLAGGIAHDFNNMLAAIIGNAELAMDDIPEEMTARHNLDQIFKAGMRARGLVRQILTFSRKTEQEHKPLPLTPLVNETFKLLRSSLPTTIEMRLSAETVSDVVLADPIQMQQVLMNLCTNAADAMRGRGGRLEVSLTDTVLHEGDPLPEEGMRPGTYVTLAVSDTGPGMHENVKSRIFEPFFTTKERGQGTGMGLAVVYGIVKSHQGVITVSSQPGQGAMFTVYLPHHTSTEKADEPLSRPAPKGKERILFVDDEEILVEMAEGILGRLGYNVVCTTDSADALQIFAKDPHAFDLVITDHTMPQMTGATLAQKLKELRPDIPLILCTGYSETISQEKAESMGIHGFVMKPLSKNELAEAVRRVLDGANAKV